MEWLSARARHNLGAVNSVRIMRTAFFTTNLLALWMATAGAATNAPFSIQDQSGTAWLIKPNGQLLFSFGACVVNQGLSREEFNPTNPGYAAFQYYPDS